MGGFLFGRTVAILGLSLDLRAAEQRVIASNIANNETPGYRARDVDFADAFERALNEEGTGPGLLGTHPAHYRAGRQGRGFRLVERQMADPGLDGNTVDIEEEMARLSANYMMYSVSAGLLKKKFDLLMTAIKEGGR